MSNKETVKLCFVQEMAMSNNEFCVSAIKAMMDMSVPRSDPLPCQMYCPSPARPGTPGTLGSGSLPAGWSPIGPAWSRSPPTSHRLLDHLHHRHSTRWSCDHCWEKVDIWGSGWPGWLGVWWAPPPMCSPTACLNPIQTPGGRVTGGKGWNRSINI